MNLHRGADTFLSKTNRDYLCGVLTLIIIATEIPVLFANGWDTRLDYLSLMHAISRAMFVVFLVRFINVDSFSLRMYCVFVVCTIVTTPVRGDLTLALSFPQLYFELFFLCLLSYGYMLETTAREKLFVVLSYMIVLLYLYLSMSMIYVAVMRTSISLPMHLDIGITEDYVTPFVVHKNIIADQLCMAFTLCLCLISYHSNKHSKVLFSLVGLIIYVALGLTRSRTSMIAASVAVALVCILIVMDKMSSKSNRHRFIACFAIALVAIPCAYKAYDLSGYAINRTNSFIEQNCLAKCTSDTTIEEIYNSTIMKDEGNPTEEEDTLFVEKRSRRRILSLTERVEIWYSGFVLLINEPERLLFGSIDYMDEINRFLPSIGVTEEKAHMHNAYLEVLMRYGLLSFMLFAFFVIVLIVRMYKVFFSRESELFAKMMTIPLLTTLIKNIAESGIVGSQNITNYIFFLVAGMFLAYSYELFPEKRVGRKTKSVDEASM